MADDRLTFKIATEPEEFHQIHRLNYQTFVEEIPQHPPNPERLLVDRFHDENCYCICLDGPRLAGMVAMRSRRPFSLDGKVEDLDRHLPPGNVPCEMRLLAVEPPYRRPGVYARLIRFAAEEGIRRGYTLAVASGTLRQTRLYGRMGFTPFAGPVGTAEATYQPMYLTLENALELFERIGLPCPPPAAPVSFMPGPVEIPAAVRRACADPPVSHRAPAVLAMVAEIRERLIGLTGARDVALLLGSGTLGNDAVAAQLRLLPGRGLVLSNGEFGERLVDHAHRMGLNFETVDAGWGNPHDLVSLEGLLANQEGIAWVWSVHCETSSGMLSDLPCLAELCNRHGVRLCLDCTSSLGTVPLDLRGVHLASSVSGKGLASLAGIALVFAGHDIHPDRRIPRYLDLGTYRRQQGVPFTHSSNLLAALCQALRLLGPEARFPKIRESHARLRSELESMGLTVMAPPEQAAPAVLSIPLPPGISSVALGEELERRGYLLSFRSGYLVARNIIQICLMGHVTDGQCAGLVEALRGAVAEMKSHG